MKLNTVKKIILSLAVIIFMILGVGQSVIYATAGSLTAKLDGLRWLPYGNTSTGWGFKLNKNGHPVYQILKVDSTGTTIGDNARLYCLNSKVGATWNSTPVGHESTYDTYCNLKNKTEVYNLLKDNSAYDISNYEYYSSIIWLLDNFYIPNKTNKEEFLANIGIVKDDGDIVMNSEDVNVKNANTDKELKENTVNGKTVYSYSPYHYHYFDEDYETYNCNNASKGLANYGPIGRIEGYSYIDRDNKIQDVLLTDEMIETVQQAAIWYFTNYKEDNATWGNDANFNNEFISNNKSDSPSWLQYIKGEMSEYSSLNDYTVDVNGGNGNVGKMYQEQAAILYNYLVDKALEAKDKGYTGAETETKISIDKSLHTVTQQTGGEYVIGPLKINSTGDISNIKLTITDMNNVDITENCTMPVITKGTEFYITVPSTTNGNIKIEAVAEVNGTKQTLWTKTGSTEQPIVEVEPGTLKTDPVTTIITNEQAFDLALRKIITGVKNAEGQVLSILSENGLDATRIIKANPSTIATTDTATYKHRKDPVVVRTGYKVTYKLNIYNEGDIDGYASIIVDQLPTGLESTLKVGDTVTSSKGNVYEVKSYTDNKLVLELTSTTPTMIQAYNGTTLDKDTIELECKVTQVEDKSKHYLTNIAYINEAKDKNGDAQAQDRKNTESKPAEYPNKTASDLNNTEVKYQGNSNNQSIYNDTNNEYYYKGQEDDDDFETIVLLPKEFDLKLVKYISAVNGDTSKGKKVTKIDTTKLASRKSTTADYTLSKDVITIQKGDYVTYTFRVYNEGEINGYVTKLTDNIPLGLQFVQRSIKNDGKTITVYNYDKTNGITTTDIEVDQATYKLVEDNNFAWGIDKETSSSGEELKLDTYDGDTTPSISVKVADYLKGTNKLLNAYDSSKDVNYNGAGLDYVDVTVVLKVSDTASINKILRNEVAITGHTDEDGKSIIDRDSQPENWLGKDDHDKYQDDEDYDNIRLVRFDLALRKFIGAISTDSKIDDGEYLTTDKTNKTEYTRAPKVDISKLKTGVDSTAIYNHPKDPITVNVGDYVLYIIRVYNEGDLDGYASKITDYLPENLNYIDGEFNKGYGWSYSSTDRSVTTTYLSSANGKDKNKLKAFDGTKLDYRDIPVLCRVDSNAVSGRNITNIAEITEYQDENGATKSEDIDSTPSNLKYPQDVPGYEGNRSGKNASDKYYPGQEDDDDFDRVIVQEPKFDLALRKFITKINNEDVTTRIPEVSYKDEKITYTHPKDVVKVVVGDTVTYTIRVYNEGKTAGYAETVTDDIPEYLEYLPENATNVAYRWKMYDKDGKETEDVTKAEKIVTDYTSKAYGEKMMADGENITENPNLLNAFNPSAEISDTNPEYVDVKVAFKVKDPNSSKYIIKNKAQISEDADENGNPVVDIDSIPNEWNDGEDDQDYENVSVEYFDLSLLKYVSEVEVTEKGTTTTTKTGNKGDKKDIIPKVEIHRKNIKSTTVKFIYTIKITNEGDIPGYAKEITDYVPEGLEFHKEDNKGWEEKKNRIITTELLSDTLLNPGESATVKVTFRWKNDENNMGVKTNIAEISKDENEKGIPDRDSTPGNKKDGEDDIDDAEVLLSIKTGVTENIIAYITGAAIILLVIAGGVILIKKIVL